MARYFVYDRSNNNRIVARNTGEGSSYATHAAALAAITRASKQFNKNTDNIGKFQHDPQVVYAIAETNHYYENLEKTVTRTNLLTGEQYQESVNQPQSCSPASETYWSM